MPVYGLGTWQMGGKKEHDPRNDDLADMAAIRAAIESGIIHIDTAEVYAAGYAETLVGQATKGYDRSKLFLVSKVETTHLDYEEVLKACERSLERLQTNYLDLYLLHGYNTGFDLKKTIQAMNKLVAQRLTKHIGVANFGVKHLQEAQGYADSKIVCDQVHYNLQFREPEHSGLLEHCQQNDIMLIAWRPVGKGNLLANTPNVLKEICKKYGKTPAQVAINWLISQPNVVTLSKTRNLEHLRENLGGLGWTMEPQDIEKLRHEYPNQVSISDVVPLG